MFCPLMYKVTQHYMCAMEDLLEDRFDQAQEDARAEWWQVLPVANREPRKLWDRSNPLARSRSGSAGTDAAKTSAMLDSQWHGLCSVPIVILMLSPDEKERVQKIAAAAI